MHNPPVKRLVFPTLTKLKRWQNACITPAKCKQCLQNAGETILHLNKLWQNASKVQFLLHNEQQTPAKCWQMQAKRWQTQAKRWQTQAKRWQHFSLKLGLNMYTQLLFHNN